MKARRPFVMTLVACMAAATFLFVIVSAAGTIIVTPTNQQGWSTADTRTGGDVNFVEDATAPGGGVGALQLTTDATTAAKAQYMHAANVPLASVTDLSYSTKQISGPPEAAASYQLPVCLGGLTAPTTANPTGCIGFTTFVYEPYYNGAVIPSNWQSWNVAAGQFWSSQNYSSGTCTVVKAPGGPPTYSLAALKTACPDAVVVGFGVNIGTFNPSYDVYTDLVKFNDTTYDFEPWQYATNKDQCKNSGFVGLRRADGSAFKNQGDCVSYTSNSK
jgi:hypothetical protein